LKIYIYLILCVLFWSGNFVLGRFVKADITPLELAFFRWFFAFIIISPIFISSYRKIFKIFTKDYKILLTLAFLGIAGFNTVLYIGLSMTTATNALIINSSIPILILILSFFILKQAINKRQLSGILLSTAGVIFLILHGDLNNLFSLEFNRGDFLVILSSSIWALYSVLLRFRPTELSDFEFFSTIVSLGLFILLPIYLYQGYTLEHEMALIVDYYYVFIYVSLFTSVASYYFWHQGIQSLGASKTGQFTHLMPIFGAILAYIFLGESLEFYHLAGIVLIACGIYMSLLTKQNTR